MTVTDLRSPRLIYFKGLLFLIGGVVATCLLLAEHPSVKVAFLLFVAVWCFARLYYFLFYVIENYVDPDYKFAGLIAFVQYLLKGKTSRSDRNSKSK